MWHKLARGILLALILCTGFAAKAAPAGDPPAAFIADLGQQAIAILQAGDDTSVRKGGFSKLFTQDFDVPAIGKFVLGRYWKTATPELQNEYIQVFGQYVVAIYAARFANYSGEQFTVMGSQAGDGGTATVKSQIIRTNGGPPISIDWQVAKEGSSYKIINVVVENVSMALTQRQEFASVVEQNGGSVPALINMLRQKLQQQG